jgi:hypothetical protein
MYSTFDVAPVQRCPCGAVTSSRGIFPNVYATKIECRVW